MNTPDSQKIVARFYKALNHLISMKVLRGKKTFTDRYDIDRRSFHKSIKDYGSDIFQPAWLTYLVNDFGISAHWLLTGQGKMMDGEG